LKILFLIHLDDQSFYQGQRYPLILESFFFA
jgi:hypothetical protein